MKYKIVPMVLVVIFAIFLLGCQKAVGPLAPSSDVCNFVIKQSTTEDLFYGAILEDDSPSLVGRAAIPLENKFYRLFYQVPCRATNTDHTVNIKKVIHFDSTVEEYQEKVRERYPDFFEGEIGMKPPVHPNGSLWKTWNTDIVEELGLSVIDDFEVYKCPAVSREDINQWVNENRLETGCNKII